LRRSELIILRTKENSKAHQKFATVNPVTKESASIITTALITNRNSPKVNTVAGKVNTTKSGLINKFRRAKTIATPIAVVNPDKYTASPKIQAVKNTLRVFTSNLNRILLIAKA
jgi:hypothetical protein